MKIVDVAEFYSVHGGGVRTYVHQKLAAGRKFGHEIVILAPGPHDGTEEREGGRIIWIKSPHLPLDSRYHMFWNEWPIHRILDQERPDVIEASSPWRGAWIARNWNGSAARALFMHSDPVASYAHVFLDDLFSRSRIDWICSAFWAYLRRLSAGFDATLVAGEWLAKRFADFRLYQPLAVPLGVDQRMFAPEMRSPALRRDMLAQCGLGPDAGLLISIGRHHPEKRLNVLIEAVAIANQNRPVGLYIVGDGISRSLTERKARSIPQVHLAGAIRDRTRLSHMLASADALFHGCASETYGLVAAEALSAGVPLIVPDVGGAADLANSDYAEIYATGDATAAATAILNLLKRDRQILSACAYEAARQRIGPPEQHFRRLFEHYAQLTRK